MSAVDLSVEIKRFPEVQNYRVNLLLIKTGRPDAFESYVCQTMVEVFEKVTAFELKHLELFENAIEYQHTDWRDLARKNLGAKQ